MSRDAYWIRFAEFLNEISARPQPTNLGVRSSNLFGRATYTTGSAQIILMIGFYP
jgi:hypothetical protein